jgi:hypothetical protein
VREKVDAVHRKESRRIFATLSRLLGDFAGSVTRTRAAIVMSQFGF